MLTLVKRSGPADSGAVAALAPLDEATLIARVRAGDRPAQDEFYRRFKRLITNNLYRVAGDRGDLEDLVQEVFVIAFRGLDRFRGDARLSTWLYRICINVSLGRMRSRSRKPLPTSVADIDANATTSERVGVIWPRWLPVVVPPRPCSSMVGCCPYARNARAWPSS